MWKQEDEYLENQNNNRKENEKEIRERLIDIYNNGNEDTKLIIEMLIHTEYELATEKDNCIRINNKYNKNLYKDPTNLNTYKEENKEIIDRVW